MSLPKALPEGPHYRGSDLQGTQYQYCSLLLPVFEKPTAVVMYPTTGASLYPFSARFTDSLSLLCCRRGFNSAKTGSLLPWTSDQRTQSARLTAGASNLFASRLVSLKRDDLVLLKGDTLLALVFVSFRGLPDTFSRENHVATRGQHCPSDRN